MKVVAQLLLLAFAAAEGVRIRDPNTSTAAVAFTKVKPEPNTTVAAKKKPKVHLDVGFTDFQKNLTSQIADQVKKAAAEAHWSTAQGDALASNVTKALADGMSVALKPLKMSIGKTWMALPQDAQKETYVTQLKNAFLPVFASSARTAESHLRLSLHRIPGADGSTGEHDVATCSKTLIDGLLAEHCYDASAGTQSLKATALAAKRAAALRASKNSTSANVTNASSKKRFCIQSVVDGLAHRLNDTQGLLSMSMRFEAGAMSLAQRAKSTSKKH